MAGASQSLAPASTPTPHEAAASPQRHLPGPSLPAHTHFSGVTVEPTSDGSTETDTSYRSAAALSLSPSFSQPPPDTSPTHGHPQPPSQNNPPSCSAVSIRASNPYAQNIRLSPAVEEEIKKAVLEATHSQKQMYSSSSPSRKGKRWRRSGSVEGTAEYKIKRKKQARRGPDGRRESLQTTRNWLIAKKVLRWVSLVICAVMVVGETVLAIFDGAHADTALGTSLGFLLGIWDTVRLVRLRLKRDIEPVSVFHLVAEGTFTAAIIVSFSCIVDQVRRFWAGEFLVRGWVFSAGMLSLEAIHITLFARACVDMYLHRDAIDWHRYNGWELPWYMESQPTEIVVKYVRVCPRCECEFSPNGNDHERDKVAEDKRSKKRDHGKKSADPPSIVITE